MADAAFNTLHCAAPSPQIRPLLCNNRPLTLCARRPNNAQLKFDSVKLKFHDSSFPRGILVTSSRVEDVRNKSCWWTLENNTDTRTNGQHYTAADRRPTNQVSASQTGRGSRRTRPTRTTCCGHPRKDVTRMLRGKRSRGI